MRSPPLPISATFSAPPALGVVITFDQNLVGGVSAGGNYLVDAANPGVQLFWTPVGTASILNNLVFFTAVPGGPAPGPDTVSYSAATPDLTGLDTGLPVAPFTIPLVIIP